MNRYFSPCVANMGDHGDPAEERMISRLIRVITMIINLCLEVAENLAKDLNRETRYRSQLVVFSLLGQKGGLLSRMLQTTFSRLCHSYLKVAVTVTTFPALDHTPARLQQLVQIESTR